MATLGQDPAGTVQDLSLTLDCTPASPMQTRLCSNCAYDWEPEPALASKSSVPSLPQDCNALLFSEVLPTLQALQC